MEHVTIIGGGLAGCEAAWQLANKNIRVTLVEMRPNVMTAAHKSGKLAELVCSNSLRSNALTNGVGLLKEEMRRFESLIMRVADQTAIPAGSALAVDREAFADKITETIANHPLITLVNQEACCIPEGPVIIATGPLTSNKFSEAIADLVNREFFYFYDAVAPIIYKDSIDFDIAYYKSRYDKGDDDYINLPMNKEEFFEFYNALIRAETVKLREFEKEVFFEGCLPIEEIASRGMKTLLFGPLKPVGLGKDGERPYAVAQLRQDNAIASLYNLVGFQTHLTYPEQQRVFRMIPGLKEAQFARYGVMHRNTYINSPSCLKNTYQFDKRDDLFFAGQLTGVEGYVESAASGLLAGMNMAMYLKKLPLFELPDTCMMGAMVHYITHADQKNFQPMNANFGIMRLLTDGPKAKRKEQSATQALEVIEGFAQRWKNI